MKLIKHATIYKATIPTDLTDLANHLRSEAFVPMTETQASSSGFVPVSDSHGLVATFVGGFAFRVRIDEKLLPSSVVGEKLQEAIEGLLHKPSRAEICDLREQLRDDLLRVAFPRTVASLTCFYHTDSQLLIIPTTSKTLAGACVSRLIVAVGSVKTETIHVSDVQHGLTTRLKDWLKGDPDHDEAFGVFGPCDSAVLQRKWEDEPIEKISVQVGGLDNASDGLLSALRQGYSVASLGLHRDGVDFRLSHDFRLHGLKLAAPAVAGDESTEEERWEESASLEVAAVVGIVTDLVSLLEYKKPEGDEVANAQA